MLVVGVSPEHKNIVTNRVFQMGHARFPSRPRIKEGDHFVLYCSGKMIGTARCDHIECLPDGGYHLWWRSETFRHLN